MTAADWPTAGHYPQPLYIVHLVPGPFLAACGQFPGCRRFDPDRGTFCQDTGRAQLDPRQAEGFEACPACLDFQTAGPARPGVAQLGTTVRAGGLAEPTPPNVNAQLTVEPSAGSDRLDYTGTLYAACCPAWCDGDHAPVLTLADDHTGLVSHSRQLLDPPPPGGLAVALVQDEMAAGADGECADWPHLIVTPPEEHDCLGVTVAELRGWAALLELAADRATELLGGVS